MGDEMSDTVAELEHLKARIDRRLQLHHELIAAAASPAATARARYDRDVFVANTRHDLEKINRKANELLAKSERPGG